MTVDYVFIVGCNRTGTSLLREILNKSERVCLTPETHFLRRFSRVGFGKIITRFGDLSVDRNAERLIDFMYQGRAAGGSMFWGWLKNHFDRQAFTERFLRSDRGERSLFVLMMHAYAEVEKGGATDKVLGEKTPTHLYYVPTLLDWFPNGKVIHTFRDPRAIAVSTVRKVRAKRRGGLHTKTPFLPGRLIDRLTGPVETLHISQAWLGAARLHEQYERRFPDRYRLLRFEDLIGDPEGRIRTVCDFIGVPYTPDLLDGVAVLNSSYHGRRSGEGFDSQVIERWRGHIDPLSKAWLSALGGKQLKRFGYPKS